MAAREIRVNFEHLYKLASASRPVKKAICVGSVPPEMDAVWQKLKAAGVTVELFERGSDSGKEQGVDQCLQVHMLRALADAESPAVAVLLTGDGAGYDNGVGFHADMARLYKKGWGIEVLSWDISCNKRLKAWAQESGLYVPLENHYDEITFRGQTRKSKTVSLKHRGRAAPRPTQ